MSLHTYVHCDHPDCKFHAMVVAHEAFGGGLEAVDLPEGWEATDPEQGVDSPHVCPEHGSRKGRAAARNRYR